MSTATCWTDQSRSVRVGEFIGSISHEAQHRPADQGGPGVACAQGGGTRATASRDIAEVKDGDGHDAERIGVEMADVTVEHRLDQHSQADCIQREEHHRCRRVKDQEFHGLGAFWQRVGQRVRRRVRGMAAQ